MTKIERQAEIHSKIKCFAICTFLFLFGMTFTVLGVLKVMKEDSQNTEMINSENMIVSTEIVFDDSTESVDIEKNESIEVSQPIEDSEVETKDVDDSENSNDFIIMETTAYVETGNNTASGVYPRVNHTVAMARQYIGRELELYYINNDGSVGNLIGRYKVEDTGGDYRIKNGTVIDIYYGSDRQSALEWGRRKVYMRWIS